MAEEQTPWKHRIVATAEVDATSLMANPKNWRLHPDAQRQALAGVLDVVGWVQRIIVNQRTGVIVDGHLRTEMAAEKRERVPVGYVDLSPDEEALILASLDPIAAQAETDQAKLNALLAEIRSSPLAVDLTAPLTEMLDSLRLDPEPEPPAPAEGEDDVPEPPVAPVSVAGDVWILGDHRVMCGDATDVDQVATLMDGERAAMAFTDPPYNVDYEGYTEERLTIQGDKMTPEAFKDFLIRAFKSLQAAVKLSASLYVCHSSSWQREFQDALEAACFEVRCQIIWAKNTFAWGFGRYKFQHEPIFYAHVRGQADPWYGDRTQSTLWLEKKPAANRLHPTMKPVELIDRALANSSKAGDVVLDLFGGSGTTLIAAEKGGRRARLMELDPKYCDVIAQRWHDFTGKVVVLGNGPHAGATFDHTRDGRRQGAADALAEEALNAA
jgi:DNA modification methylase